MMTAGSTLSRKLVTTAVALLAVSVAWSTGSALASSSPSPAPGKAILRIGTTEAPDNLNPFIGVQQVCYEIWCLNYDMLFMTSPNGHPELDLAAEFPTKQNGGVSADGKVWTIHIRPGVKWQDGQPLTAEDVAWTYNSAIKAPASNFGPSLGFVTEAKALNGTTVQIVCSRPKADMEYVFLPILPKHIWQHMAPQAAQTTFANRPPIVGSGPFQTVTYVPGQYVTLVRNPSYWGRKPALDEIIFETYQNPDTMVSDLTKGTIDAAWGIPEAEFAQLQSVKGIKAVAYNFFTWDYLSMNCYAGKSSGNPVLRDWRFRYALNYAVDRQRLCDLAYQGYARVGTTILPPNEWTNPDYHWQPPASELYTFDLAKASQLLTAAGYPLKDGVRLNKQGKPIRLRLWAPTDSSEELTAAKLITGWFTQLGLKITNSVMDTGALYSHIYNYQGKDLAPDFDMYVWDWIGFADPGQTLSSMTPAGFGNSNEPAWSNAAYNRLNDLELTTLDAQKRQAVIWQMQQVMYEQTPWLVLVYPDQLEAYNTNKWTGWTRAQNGQGPAFYTGVGNDTYLNLRPTTTATSATGGGAKGVLAIVVGIVVVAGVVLLLARRRRGRLRIEES